VGVACFGRFQGRSIVARMEAAFWKRAARANHRWCLSDLCDLDVALVAFVEHHILVIRI
jgi:hypothetical protein